MIAISPMFWAARARECLVLRGGAWSYQWTAQAAPSRVVGLLYTHKEYAIDHIPHTVRRGFGRLAMSHAGHVRRSFNALLWMRLEP